MSKYVTNEISTNYIQREKQEQAYQEAQAKRLEEARLRKEAELAALEKADQERRLEDARLKGYLHELPPTYYGYRYLQKKILTHFNRYGWAREPSEISKSEAELNLENELKQEKKESGQLEGNFKQLSDLIDNRTQLG